MNTSFSPKPMSKKTKNLIIFGVIAVIVIAFIASSLVVVPAGSTGVVITLGSVSDDVLPEGLHFKIPFVQEVEVISNKIQKQEVEANAVSKDLQTVSSSIAVNFRVANSLSANIFKNIGREYQEIVLLPAVQESMKSVTAKYTAEELITMRAQVGQEVKETLESKVNEYGITIEKFNIVDFQFSPEFNAAIEAKQVAEQNLLKAKTEQEQALVIAETEAQKKVIQAEADAEAIQKQAEAEAAATVAKATAQAEANRVLNESLSSLVNDYLKIQKWDGKLPTVMGGSDTLVGIDTNK